MAWSFADSFDLYATSADPSLGYWDSSGNSSFGVNGTGRFGGSKAWVSASISNVQWLVKSSGVNDAVHHIAVAFTTATASGATSLGHGFTLYDGTTPQCSIMFNRDYSIQLISGAANSGTVLATYPAAWSTINTWYAFEFEVVINNTTGSFKVRKNGNTTDDFTATGLNTRPVSTNNYANKLAIVSGPGGSGFVSTFDDFFWRSDSAAGTWLGDIRCYTRMPASDQSVTFSRSPGVAQNPGANQVNNTITAGSASYMPFVAATSGTLSSILFTLALSYTGNLKCTIYADSGSNRPSTPITSATIITNPAAGPITFNFPTPLAAVQGTTYWIGMVGDTTLAAAINGRSAGNTGYIIAGTYAAFPASNPTGVTAINNTPWIWSLTITPGVNALLVSEAQQDAAISYVYSSNPGDADFYGIASIAATPATVIGVTTRAYMQKSDAGTRTSAVQLKSGASTVASPTLTLTPSGWQWAWRMDLVDPATSAAWTAAAVNAAQIGPRVVA
jgi:hypothetical protein